MLTRHAEFKRDRDGVSVVVSAVLVFGLIIMVMAVYLMTIVPDQVREAEAAHMRRVHGSMGDLAHHLGQASALAGGAQFSQQIDLGTTSVPFFAAVESSGRLSVQEEAFFASVSCDTTRLVARDGAASPGAEFEAASGSIDVSEVLVLEFLVSGYTMGAAVHTATVTVSTVSAGTVGSFEVRLDGPKETTFASVTDASGTVLTDQVVQTGGLVQLLRINALDPIYGFASVLADVQGVRSLTFSPTAPAEVTVYAVGRADDGTLVAKGSGRELPPGFGFARSINSASIAYESTNQRFMDQRYVLEGGALVTSQASGDFLAIPPFQAVTGGVGADYLRLTLVNLTGTGDTAGTHSATVSAVVRSPVVSILECTEPRLLFTTGYPDAWQAAWQDELRRAGIGPGAVSVTGFVSVDLAGTWFIELTEARADLRVA